MSVLPAPIHIAPNANRTSQTLDDALETLVLGMQQIDDDVLALDERLGQLSRRMALRAECLASVLPGLAALPSGDGSHLYLDLHDLGSGTLDPASSATWWSTYGVAFPRLAAPAYNQLTYRDDLGQIWLPTATELAICRTTDPESPIAWTSVDSGLDARPHVMAAVDERPESALEVLMGDYTYLWLRVDLPLSVLHNSATNALAINLQPELRAVLQEARYSADGAVWSDNLVGEADGRLAAPELFFLPAQRVVSLKFLYYLPAPEDGGPAQNRACYLTHVGAYNFWYQEGGLVLNLNSLLPSDKQLDTPETDAVNPSEARTVERADLPTPELTSSTPGLADSVTIALRVKTNGVPQALRQLKFPLIDR